MLMKFSTGGPLWHLPAPAEASRALSHGITGHLSSSTRNFPYIGENRCGGATGAVTLRSGSVVRASCAMSASAHKRIAPAAAAAIVASARIAVPLLGPTTVLHLRGQGS